MNDYWSKAAGECALCFDTLTDQSLWWLKSFFCILRDNSFYCHNVCLQSAMRFQCLNRLTYAGPAPYGQVVFFLWILPKNTNVDENSHCASPLGSGWAHSTSSFSSGMWSIRLGGTKPSCVTEWTRQEATQSLWKVTWRMSMPWPTLKRPSFSRWQKLSLWCATSKRIEKLFCDKSDLIFKRCIDKAEQSRETALSANMLCEYWTTLL